MTSSLNFVAQHNYKFISWLIWLKFKKANEFSITWHKPWSKCLKECMYGLSRSRCLNYFDFRFMEKPRYHNLLLSAWEQVKVPSSQFVHQLKHFPVRNTPGLKERQGGQCWNPFVGQNITWRYPPHPSNWACILSNGSLSAPAPCPVGEVKLRSQNSPVTSYLTCFWSWTCGRQPSSVLG